MERLEKNRGKGRNDYPVRATWNAMIAGVVFQHESVACLLRELKRNGELRGLCGFDPSLGGAAVPSDDAFSHFLGVVMEHQIGLQALFDGLVDELTRVLPDLGKTLAVDSKAIPSFGRPVRDQTKAAEPDRRRDTDADWGKKTYKGTRKDGTTWQKVTRWFGYKLHLLVDSKYELPLAFVGFEHERRTLKYRCPAAACGLTCRGRNDCEQMANVGPFGRVIRVPLELDRRIFTPIARTTYKWRKAYARRTSVERVNARLDRVLGFERHYIRGQEKMKTRMTLALVIMLAMALGRIRIGQQKKLRSLTAPIRFAA